MINNWFRNCTCFAEINVIEHLIDNCLQTTTFSQIRRSIFSLRKIVINSAKCIPRVLEMWHAHISVGSFISYASVKMYNWDTNPEWKYSLVLNIGNERATGEFNSRTFVVSIANEEWNGNWQQAIRLQGLKLANRAIRSISANSKSSWNFRGRRRWNAKEKKREREGGGKETRFRALFFSRRRGGLWYLVSTAGNVSNERGNDLAVIFRFSTAKHVETTEAIAPK